MPVVLGPALVAAVVLAVAGAQKLLDPTMTVGALRALRLPSAPLLVRAGSGAELALGAGAAVFGGPVAWSLVSVSYAAFSVVVVAALRAGSPLGTCGCFGREETPPHVLHVALNLALAGAAAAAGAGGVGGLDELPGAILARAGVAALVLLGCILVYACYVAVPRALAAAAAVRELELSSLGQAHQPGGH